MICGAVSTVTVYLTSLNRLRSDPASTNTFSVSERHSTVAMMVALSPLCCGEIILLVPQTITVID